jgi:homoserine O-acetyltransferase
MLSYRYHETFNTLQAEKDNDKIDNYRAASYQRYQGQKLANRFNAFTYWRLSKMMDSHNVGRHRGSAEEALKNIKAKTLVIGIDTDILFPVSDQKFLANHIQHAHYVELTSLYAHDGFLVEVEQINNVVKEFFQQKKLSPVLS